MVLVGVSERRNLAQGKRGSLRWVRRIIMEIEYRCPAHGVVEVFDRGTAEARCPLTRSKRTGSGVVVESCGLALLASSDERQKPTRVVTPEQHHDDGVVLRAAIGCGQDIFDAISLLAVPALHAWVDEDMELAQGRVQRALDRLEEDRLVERTDTAYCVTHI